MTTMPRVKVDNAVFRNIFQLFFSKVSLKFRLNIFVDIFGSIFVDGDFAPYLGEAELIFAGRQC